MSCDFVVSSATVDERWAAWVAAQLETAGFAVARQPSQLGDEGQWVDELPATATVLALLSPVYVATIWDMLRRQAAARAGLAGFPRPLLAVCVRPCAEPESLDGAPVVSLADVEEAEARERLLAAARPTLGAPEAVPAPDAGVEAAQPPDFPGRSPVSVARREYARLVATVGEDHLETIGAARALAGMFIREYDYAAARAAYEGVLERSRRVLGADHPDTISAATWLSHSLLALGDYEETLTLRNEVHARLLATLGADHPKTIAAASDAAEALSCVGDHAGARAALAELLSRCQRVFGDDDQRTRNVDQLAAIVALRAGQTDGGAGVKAFERSLADCRRLRGDDHLDTVVAEYTLGAVLNMAGDLPAARASLAASRSKARRLLGAQHEVTLMVESELATTLRSLGEQDDARDLLAHLLTSYRRVLGDDDPTTAETARRLAALPA
jgi:Tetratricopeptide repeat/TIR domain